MKFKIGFEKEDTKQLHEFWDEIISKQQWSEGKFINLFEEKWSEHNQLHSVVFSSWGGAALADMANAFVEALHSRLQELAVTEASPKRLFFEEQLKKTKDALMRSEEAMIEFQEKTGILKVEEQAMAVIGSIVALRAQIAAKEVELMVMKTYSTENNPDLQLTQEALKGLKAELKKLEKKEGSNPDTLIPTGRMPSVGTNYIRKLRNLKSNEKLFEIMAKQYEMAGIGLPKFQHLTHQNPCRKGH